MNDLAARGWTLVRWLLGWSTPPPRPATHMTPDAVASLVRTLAASARLPFGSMPPQLRIVQERLVWRVDSATIGGGWRVEVDDATGQAGPVTWWGSPATGRG